MIYPVTMSLEQTEDLKAFERRLTEVIANLQPGANRWRFVLFVVSTCTAVGAWAWLFDPETSQVALTESLTNHPFFGLSCVLFVMLFCSGIHKRVVAPSIISTRCRTVLLDYNMSCDDSGKLILKPRPSIQEKSTEYDRKSHVTLQATPIRIYHTKPETPLNNVVKIKFTKPA